jgi:uncharacterized protein (TIGR03086 family)
MDIVRLHESALDETARLVDGVRPDQMGLPTPCSEWDVRTLIAHLVGGNVRFLDVAEGKPRPERTSVSSDVLGDDPAGAYRRSAEALKQAWRDPSRLDQQCELPVGVMPGRAALNLHLVETVAHAWDLAKATGQQPAFDPDVVQAAAQFARSTLPEDRPPGMPFAPPVPVPDDLSELDRLAAYLGRTP